MSIPKRKFGRSGRELTVLGLGGFHLLEISDRDAVALINRYLDEGGNYIETAPGYGDGESERKIGLVMKDRRDECFLVTKNHDRDRESAWAMINKSLCRLQTDHVDLLLHHNLQTEEELEQIYAPGGAMEAFLQAREEGKTRYIGITAHGDPGILIKALREKPHLDAVMTVFNFFDRFNFPDTEKVLLPLAREKGVGIIAMKTLGDGLLWAYPEQALRYTLSLPIDVLPVGFNTLELLEKDLEIVRGFEPMSEQEREDLYKHPVLGSYVCRLCDKCLPCPEGIDMPKIFRCEGMYDRQLRDRTIRTMPEFALRDRLRFWFQGRGKARAMYRNLSVDAQACTRCGECLPKCPYDIDIIGKLEYCHFKLTTETTVKVEF